MGPLILTKTRESEALVFLPKGDTALQNVQPSMN